LCWILQALARFGRAKPGKRIGASVACLVWVVISGQVPVDAAVQDYAGIYSGTYSGDDTGTWSVICATDGEVLTFSWSNAAGQPDVGLGTVSAAGHITVTTEGEEWTSINAYVQPDDTVSGTWYNPYEGVGGSLSGRKSLPQELGLFSGSYAGTFAGDDTGTWTAVIDSDGVFTGTGWSNENTDNFEFVGFVNHSGELFAVAESDAIVRAMINLAGILQGTWHDPEGEGGTISGTRAAPISKPTVATGAAASVTAASATLEGTVNPNGAATSYYFEYGPTTAYGHQTAADAAGSGTSGVPVSAPLSGLAPGSLYHFRLVATNSAGSAYGGDEAFTTLAAAPVAVTGGAVGVTPDYAVLHGKVTPNGAATTYFFEYGESTDYDLSTSVKSAGAGTAPIAVSAAVSSLLADTTYHYRLVAENSEGTSGGEDETFSTEILYVEPSGICGGKSPCYQTLQAALAAAGTGATINIAQGVYDEAPVLSASKTLALSGGWDDQFTAATASTTISGMGLPPLSIENGTLVVERLMLR
jgi:hypothetical protein